MKHRTWIAISGYLWLFMGLWLLNKGLHLISAGTAQIGSFASRFSEPQQAATCLIAVGLFVGFFKGRFVLSKTVTRVVNRILSLPLPIRLKDAYAKSYWLIILFMMGLGMVFRFLPIAIDVRGTIDVAIGSALINGAMLYLRAARTAVPTT